MPDSGNTLGTFTEYFTAGTIKGAFNLAPEEAGPLSSTSFASQRWIGSLKITGGTGAYSAIRRTTGGVLKCSSPDSVHLSCTEKIRVNSLA